MSGLVRLSMSLEKELHDNLERMLKAGRYASRSDLFRDLIRSREVDRQWEQDGDALGTITLVYDHDDRTLARKLTKAQHSHHGAVLATTHVHLDAHLCAEMIMVRGKASEIRELADELGHQKGVLHSALSVSTTGRALRHGHSHGHGHPHPHPHASR
jgi:CopG family nickel-responsive transcriptional regulator